VKADDELRASFDLLARRRSPYAGALSAVAGDVLARFPPGDGGPVLEIGAGGGALRRLLPASVGARLIQSERSPTATRALRAAAPGAPMLSAAAEALPVSNGACGAVVALCVFDALADPEAAAAEIARVLAPGGRFVHLLDMATLLEQPFAKLAGAGLVPIPNVFGDPGDHEWPLDIVLLRRDWLTGLLRFAGGAGHPFAAGFAAAFAPFLSTRAPAPSFDVAAATAAFKAIAGHGDRRRTLAAALTSASRAYVAAGHSPVEPLPFHSGRYLQSLLATTFTTAGFTIELSDIVAKSIHRPATTDERGLRYRSLCLGHERLESTLPGRLLTPAPDAPAAGEILVEAGVFCFVARR